MKILRYILFFVVISTIKTMTIKNDKIELNLKDKT